MRGVEYKPRLGLGGGLFVYKRGGFQDCIVVRW